MSSVVEIVQEIAMPIIEKEQFELVDIEYVKEGKNWFLRLFIDKPGGIDIEECAIVSEQLSEQLDVLDPDPIPHAYFLEVSSPGAERPLKTKEEIKGAVGEYIHVFLYQQIDGEKQYQGILEAATDEEITMKVRIKTREKSLTIPQKNIAKARLAIQF